MTNFSQLTEFQQAFIRFLGKHNINYEDLTNCWNAQQECFTWSGDYETDWGNEQAENMSNLIGYINNFKNSLKDKSSALDDKIFGLCMIRTMTMNYSNFFEGIAEDIYKILTEYYYISIAPLQYSVKLQDVLTLRQSFTSNDNTFEILRLSILDFMTSIKGEKERNEILIRNWDDQARCYIWMLDYSMNWQSIHEYYYTGLVLNMNRFIMISDSRDKKLEITYLSELYYFLMKLHQFLYYDLLSDLDRLIKIHKNLNSTI